MADIGLVNGGGIRANIEPGDVTYGNLIDVQPFNNQLAYVDTLGQNILDALEVGASKLPEPSGGLQAVLVTPACYDPLYRRAVRVSMGTVFQVPWTRIGEEAGAGATGTGGWAPDGVPLLHELGFKTAAFALTDDSVPLDDPALNAEERLALVFGTEGDGLAHDTIARCDYTVRIPMACGVDSLNVAAASAVAFWQLRR